MKKTIHLFSILLFNTSLSIALAACQDTCLEAGGHNGSDGSEQNDALAQKYQALQTLLGSLADVDSLPSNWNSDTYTVTPTVGDVNNDANPHVRYVVTTSQAEADRIYRSYLSKDVTGTPSNDTWKMDGIGSMQFKLENDPNLFATLRVNVQQLPTLEEIRFVSEDALGSNGLIKPTGTYYSFGDVVCQVITDSKGNVTPTFWVCTRPCCMSPRRRQSHWCSFQLVPAGDKNQQNFICTTNEDDDNNSYLPTLLGLKKSDAEQQVQNFFNVLRLMANPNVALSKDYTGIDEIASNNAYEQASYNTLRTTSFMWDYLNLWEKEYEFEVGEESYKGSVANKNLSTKKNLKGIFGDVGDDYDDEEENAEDRIINAYYYGYSKNFFATGDYTVYNLQLSTPKANSPFLNVKKQTAYVTNQEGYDFREFENGVLSDEHINFGNDQREGKYQFIVKYRTGGELEGLSHSSIDKDPSKPFSERLASNHIYDILVSGNAGKTEAYNNYNEGGEQKLAYPFFCIGDIVTKTQADVNGYQFKGFQFCVRNAYNTYTTQRNEWKNRALFIGYSNEGVEDKIKMKSPTKEDIATGLFQILQSQLVCNKESYEVFTEEFEHYPNNLLGEDETLMNETDPLFVALKELYDKVRETHATFSVSQKDGERTATLTIKVNSDYYSILLTRTGQGKNAQDKFTITRESAHFGANLQELSFYTYFDRYGFRDEYSQDRDLIISKRTERNNYKKSLADQLQNALNSTKYVNF